MRETGTVCQGIRDPLCLEWGLLGRAAVSVGSQYQTFRGLSPSSEVGVMSVDS